MNIVILDGYTENPDDLSWDALESRQRLMDTAVDNLKQFLSGTPVNVVNP